MYIVEVIPLIRGSQLDSLSYYSSASYDLGTIVSVPIRKQEAQALVMKSTPVSAAKTAVRAATFSLKKLPVQTEKKSLPPLLIETAKLLTKQVPATLGSVLFALLPIEVREGRAEITSSIPCIGTYEVPAVFVLQATEDERLRTYRSRIREAFAHRGSVLLVVPTSAHVEKVSEKLGQGIDDRVVTLCGTLSEKKIIRGYETLRDLSHAKLIIVTPSHAFIDRPDITHIIIDHSRSAYYKSKVRPYLDLREALLLSAKVSGREVILGDLLPRAVDEYMRQNDFYQTEGEHPKRLSFPGKTQIVRQRERPKPDLPFKLVSHDLKREIELTLKRNRNVFVYSARRGLAPVVVCGDCGYIFRCPDSGAPYSLLRTKKPGVASSEEDNEERWFLSSTSGRRVRAADTCPDCGSWRLRERGVGIQQAEDELREAFPDEKIIVFDHTTATTARKAKMLSGEFYDSKGAIMLGTSMVLPYLEKPIALSAILSIDAARAIPSWQADEEFFSLLLTLREKSTDMVMVQTRTESDDILKLFKTGQVDQFYTDELELREQLGYPPFSTFIHLTIAGTAESVTAEEELIKENLVAYKPSFYNAPHSTPGKTVRYGLIRVPKSVWPEKKLVKELGRLSPAVRIEINPTRIV